MIERISTMIMQLNGKNDDWRRYSDDAFSIIRDLYDPTPEMQKAARGKWGVDAWHAMLDVILAEDLKGFD